MFSAGLFTPAADGSQWDVSTPDAWRLEERAARSFPRPAPGPAERDKRKGSTGGWFRSLLALEVAGMPRRMRMEYPGAIYHVMDRGDRRESGSRLAGKVF